MPEPPAPPPAPDLAAIEARAAAATPPPWGITGYQGGLDFNGPPMLYGGYDPEYGEPLRIPANAADRAFIAAARSDVPALVAYARALEAENARLREALATVLEYPDRTTEAGYAAYLHANTVLAGYGPDAHTIAKAQPSNPPPAGADPAGAGPARSAAPGTPRS